jgi:DNA polymerase
MDFETQSDLDLTITGTLKYVLDPSTRVLLLSWAVDDAPVKLWCPDFGPELDPEVWAYVKSRVAAIGEPPAEIVPFFQTPGNYMIASNAAFDRSVWQQVATPENGFPRIEIENVLCSQAQAQASNLSGSLDMAGRALGLGNKTVGGKAIMKRFADRRQPLPGSPADIARLMGEKGWSRAQALKISIESWDLYLTYGVQDTELMREVWKCTRPLDREEWQSYWTSERINDRGMLADLEVCRGAMAYREEEAQHVIEQIKTITNGQIAGPTFTAQINAWVYERLPDDLREFMVKARDEETGEATRLTGAKDVMTRLLEEIELSDTPPADEVIDLIEVLQFGRASSAVKFEKIYNQAVVDDDTGANREVGRLCGSYVFNGAGQTGRFSSRGVQVHNLPRAFLDNELDVLDMVANRVPIAKLREIGPIPSVLSKLIRPTFIAPEGKVLVWGDWAAIEARVNPWLADSRDAEEAVLAPYRNGDDIYILNAEPIFNIPADIIRERYENGDPEAKGMRQASKIASLALAFLGSVGALRTMARGYGMRLSNEEAKVIVDGWRDRNGWARKFGDKAERAAFSAMRHPGDMFKAGRLTYQYLPGLMGGTLLCYLPDGRPITYPKAKISRVEKFGKMADVITYLHGMGRRSLWNGLQIQGGTQATAASILRSTLDRLEAEETEAEIVLHTHDEVGGEVDETKAGAFAERLHSTMVRGFDWSEGLPLAAEVSTSWFYTKAA